MTESSAALLKRLRAGARREHWEQTLLFQMKASGIPAPTVQHVFYQFRKWAFDFAWPAVMVAVEVEGGTGSVKCGACGGRTCQKCRWTGIVRGRHVSKAGFQEDAEKYNTAALMGWTVYRFTSAQVKSGDAVRFIWGALNRKKA